MGFVIKYVFHRSLKIFALLWGLAGLILLSVGMSGHLYMGFSVAPYWFSFTSAGFFLLLAYYLLTLRNLMPEKIWISGIIIFAISLFSAAQKYNLIARSELPYDSYWLQHAPKNPLPMIAIAHLKIDSIHYAEGLKLYQKVLDISDYNPVTIYNAMAMAYINRGQIPIAREYISKALSIHARHPQSLYLLGVLAQREGDLEVAKKYYQEALGVAPSFTQASLRLSAVYSLQNNPDKAIKVLQEAHRLSPRQKYLCPIETQLIFAYLSKGALKNGFTILESLLNRRETDCILEVSESFRRKGMDKLANQLTGIAQLMR
jgi:tetratricopeptide (TPR) repeat protein